VELDELTESNGLQCQVWWS